MLNQQCYRLPKWVDVNTVATALALKEIFMVVPRVSGISLHMSNKLFGHNPIPLTVEIFAFVKGL